MSVDLPYGSHSIPLYPPTGRNYRIIEAPQSSCLVTREKIEEALEKPIGMTAPFGDDFGPNQKVTIIVSDITRKTGADLFLPPMIDRLNRAGVRDEKITILFSNGIHRRQTELERRSVTGELIHGRIASFDHNPDGDDLATVSLPQAGERVKLNRKVFDCDRLILTGSITSHYLAGFGGGGKSLMPGVAGRRDAEKFHALCLDPASGKRRQEAASGNLSGNPLHEMTISVLQAVGPSFLLNTITGGSGGIVDLVAGDCQKAFYTGCKIAAERCEVTIEKLADTVVASCGGFPKDINYIQAHKSYDNAVAALKPGGKLFLLAECRDGIGSESFLNWFEHKSAGAIGGALLKNFVINGQTAMATLDKSESCETILLSKLDHNLVRAMGIRPAESVEAFIKEAAKAMAESKISYVIPEAGFIRPRLYGQ